MGMGLQERRAGTHDLSTFLSGVARCTDGKQTSLWWWQIRTLRQSTLSGRLPGAIKIEDDPSVPLPIPQTTHAFGRSGASERILQEHGAQRFYTGFIQCREKATERGTMREFVASEQGHELGGKWGEALVIGRQRRLSAERVADEHDHKVDHLIGPEAFAGEANTLGDFGK